MVIEWKERKHSEEDELAMENKRCMESLRDYGLKRFFLTSCLHAQLELLQHLIIIWDEDQENFILRDQELEIDISDVYFITGLSRNRETPLITHTWPCMENMPMVIDSICPGAWKGSGGGKVNIQTIPNLAIKVVLYTIT